jgi:dolichol-phosphate mannosyltransferase
MKLKELQNILPSEYSPTFIFVDDGSKDKTYKLLNENTSILSNVVIIRHDVNRNLGAALKTGIKAASESDLIAFLDSDCTYEPIVIIELLKKIEAGADFVTVSPYHPSGLVEGVPEWRLFLSKVLCFMYRVILHTNFYTYTAMVRVIKTKLVSPVLSQRNDYSFVAAMFIRAIHLKYKITEVPTILKVRKFGVSKINILKTIKSHIVIIGYLLAGKEV